MATIIGLPKLSPTMEEGVLAKWHKKEGDKIAPGDIVAEVETDKANMDFPIEDEGTLLKLLVHEGDTVKLGAPVAILGEQGEDIGGLIEKAGKPAAEPAKPAGESAKPAPETPKPSAGAKPAPSPGPRPSPRPSPNPSPNPSASPSPAPKAAPPPPAPAAKPGLLASPLAKTLAAENGIDLRTIQGTGPGGRIVERDVRAAMDGKGEAAPTQAAEPVRAPRAAPSQPVVVEGEEFTDKSLSLMRKTIARRLLEAKQTIPHFYLTSDCDAAPLVGFRAAINKIVGEDGKVTLNDLVVKAAALALRQVPAANASFLGDRIRYHGRVHIGVAVSVEDGLITPVVRDTDTKGIRAIAAEIRDLAGRARARKLTPEEMSGSTFTVSNLGMFGIDHFQAIINPPEAALLAVGAVRKQPVVVDGALAVGERMALSLSCDHRVVDGVLGAKLMAALVAILENPAALAL